MRYKALSRVEDLGEESGREEAACDFPDFSDDIDSKSSIRMLTRYGRGRAQGLYRLRGKKAKVFALSWRIGYFATYYMFKREGHLKDETMGIQQKNFTNSEAEFSMWIYEGGEEEEDHTVTTDLAGYSSFSFTFGSREDRDAFLALLQRVKEIDVD
jgi:hypothetical protein